MTLVIPTHIFLVKASHMVMPKITEWGGAILPRACERENEIVNTLMTLSPW